MMPRGRRAGPTRTRPAIVEAARAAFAARGYDAVSLRSIAGTQIVGLAMGRKIVEIAPLADADPAWLAAMIGPTIQRYLTAPLARGGARGDAGAAGPICFSAPSSAFARHLPQALWPMIRRDARALAVLRDGGQSAKRWPPI